MGFYHRLMGLGHSVQDFRMATPEKRRMGIEQNDLLGHDLRSAVFDMLGGLRLLDVEGMSDANKSHITRISASADMILRLLDEGKGRVVVGDLASVEKPVDVNAFLSETALHWQDRIASQALELVYSIEVAKDKKLACSQLDLERILSNLLENAIKFSPTGSAINLEANEETGFLELRVRDQGPGFSAAAQKKLFSSDGRPEGATVPGSGLGLYIVHGIVKRLQGQVWVVPCAKGAEVCVKLPLSAREEEPEAAAPKQAPLLQGMRILVVEDNKTNQIVARQMLATLGAEVTIANDGIEGWDCLVRDRYDVALLDIEMPRKSGIELIRDIRACKQAFAQMPLIALTAYFMREHQVRIMQAGANGVIAKPLMSIEQLGLDILRYRGGRNALADVEIPVDAQIYANLKQTMGETAFQELLDKLLIDFTGVRKRLLQAFSSGSRDELRSGSHVLISLAGAVGAMELLNAAQSLNTAMHSFESVNLASCEQPLLGHLDALIEYLETVRDEYRGG